MVANIRLRSNAIGLIAVAGMAAVIMSPSLGLYFNWGGMAIATGPVGPLVYLAALAITLPTAYCYATVSREIPSAGQAYTWLWRAAGARIGFWTGIVLVAFYFASVWVVLQFFALFFHDLLAYLGFEGGMGASAVGLLVCLGLSAWIAYRGIEINAKIAVGFLVFETIVVFGLGLIIFVVNVSQGHASLEPFNPAAAIGGFDGFKSALIFGVLSFIGFDAAAILAEEAKTPKRSVPIAVILAVVFVGLFWVVTSYFLSMSVPMSEVAGYVAAGFTPITPIAHKYLGAGDIIVIFTGLTASLGIMLAIIPSCARILYAMGRDGSLPHWLGEIHPQTKTPWNALHVVFVLGGVVALGMPFLQGSFFNAYAWFGTMSALVALTVYSMVCASTVIFFWRFRRAQFNPILNGFVPLVALAVNVYVAVNSFIVPLASAPWALGSSIVAYVAAVWIVALLYTIWLSMRNPELVKRTALGLDSEDPESIGGAA